MPSIKVKQSIYDGTILEGIPYNFQWNEKRPKVTYTVEPKAITIHNYNSWWPISRYHTIPDLQKMFLHDICHAILYTQRKECDRVFQDDFGLTWATSKRFDDVTVFSNPDELNDEFKIVMVEHIIKDQFLGKRSDDELIYKLVDELSYLRYTLEHTEEEKRRQEVAIEHAYDYWYLIGIDKIKETINTLKNNLMQFSA